MLAKLHKSASIFLAFASCLWLTTPPSNAAPKATSAKTDAPLSLPLAIQRVTLENGLRIVMNVDRSSPTIAIAVTYDVGSRNEEPGKTGFAHTFEHLMFGQTKNLAEGQFESLVVGRGGFLSAITLSDRTAYFMVVPENELALGLWLEAERMRYIDVNAASFEAERKIIDEEHRLRISNAAYGHAYWRVQELSFDGCFPYAHQVPGAPADLARAELSWVRDFHAAHYGPNTAVLSLSGDFDADTAMNFVHRYFDDIPRIQAKPFVEPTLPTPKPLRREIIDDALARVPGLSYGLVVPKPLTRDYDALRYAAVILGDGDLSRLSTKLVQEKEALATSATASFDDYNFSIGPGLLRMEIRLAPGASVAEVEKRVDEVLASMEGKAPTAEEMVRARRKIEMALAMRLAWTRNRAIELGRYELGFGDARVLTRAFDAIAAVTPEDVRRATAAYFDRSHWALVETRPITPKSETEGKTASRGTP